MLKKLNWYDVRETERIIIKKEDLNAVNECIDNEIELTYDAQALRVYNEAGNYIADIEDIRECEGAFFQPLQCHEVFSSQFVC